MYYFIINPASRSGLGMETWKQIEKYLAANAISYNAFLTKRRYHATKLAQRIAGSGKHCTLIAIGGDGTINEVLNGLSNAPQVVFACIPAGSGNDYLRELPIPSDPVEVFKKIIGNMHTLKQDLGKMTYKDNDCYFGVSMGIGFDASICAEAYQSKFKKFLNKFRLGKLTYIGIALKQLILYKPTPITIRMDSDKGKHIEKCYFIAAMNKKYEGGGLKLCPDAASDDGYLDVCVVGSLSKAKIFMVFPTAYLGKHLIFKGVDNYRCKSLEILSDIPLHVHADGEPCGLQNRLTVTILPGILNSAM